MTWLIWLGIAVLLIIIEAFTFDLVAVWFAASALVLTIVTSIVPTLDVFWQIAIFVSVTAVLLISTRNAVKKFMMRKKGQETNLELIVNHNAMVVEDINNDEEVGAVKINGLIWSARAKDGQCIDKGTIVVVDEIRGNKLIVIKK
ncbi:MAG: NfeD family protein [Clostridia bacterium]|nr:NfeD family protein [Clostridia bacterium]